MFVGGGCSVESCSGGILNFAEKRISRGANCQVFALAVFEIRRAPRVFLYCFAHFPAVIVRVATLLIYLSKNPQNFPQSKIENRRSKNRSAGNPPQFLNPGLKSTRTDAILKKFEFKMNFKLKINLKRIIRKSDLSNEPIYSPAQSRETNPLKKKI
jgi:hypothetical protein